ncbi:MAG: NAD-dependent epimerase/dehydratase family protein, partial [Pseudomonadota bacterium]
FTVYGPWSRPDMAMLKFAHKIMKDEPIDVFNYGKHKRDFTYIDDIVEGVIRVLDRIPLPNPDWSSDKPDSATSTAPYRLYNIGNNEPVELMRYIEVLEESLGKKAKLNMLPLQDGDVVATYADVADLIADTGYKPDTKLEVGVENFANWFREYYKY